LDASSSGYIRVLSIHWLSHEGGLMNWRIRSRLALAGALLLAAVGCTTTSSSAPPLPGGVVMGWGGNSSGQLGDGTTNQHLAPVPVPSLKSVRSVAAGGNSSMALTTDGAVFVWGDGQPSPTEVTPARGAKAIAAGNRHRMALMPDGSVLAWGDNNLGQLGDATVTPRPSPVQVVGLSGVVAIAAAGDQSYAIGPNFGLWSWGDNALGQLGDGTKTPRSPSQPARVGTLQVIEVAASSTHALALTTAAELYGWGSNAQCQLLQDGVTANAIVCSEHLSPKPLLTGTTGVSTRGGALAATRWSSLWVEGPGTVWATGAVPNDPTNSGLCAIDAALGTQAQVYGPAGMRVAGIAAGTDHALLHDEKGSVWALGANPAGQLGLGTATAGECATLIPPASLRGAVALAAGAEHSLAIVRGILESSPTGTLDLGAGNVGRSVAPRTVTIRNSGLAPVSFAAIRAVGDGFSSSDTCPRVPGSLAPGASCDTTVGFTPAAVGARSGTLEVTSNAVTGTWQVPLAGRGTEPRVAFAPVPLDFGAVAVGSTSPTRRTVATNVGDGPLEVAGLTATAGFALASDDCPRPPAALAPQGSCNVDVTFVPSVAGQAVGELRLAFDGKTATASLTGTGQ
jgi:hypothetical protein